MIMRLIHPYTHSPTTHPTAYIFSGPKFFFQTQILTPTQPNTNPTPSQPQPNPNPTPTQPQPNPNPNPTPTPTLTQP